MKFTKTESTTSKLYEGVESQKYNNTNQVGIFATNDDLVDRQYKFGL